jgi:flagellar biosynthetic protein FliR
MISEAALGIGIGLAVAFVTEALLVAAQTLGLQAGYAFASMVDPNTQADSGILVVFAQLAAGLLFFGAGLDREVLRIFARSLDIMPAGSFVLSRGAGERLLTTGAAMFSTGVRLALPVIAVLAMVDISLALLGRVNSQLQLLTIAFPIKMMLALTVFGWILVLLPAVMRSDMGMALRAAKGLLVH